MDIWEQFLECFNQDCDVDLQIKRSKALLSWLNLKWDILRSSHLSFVENICRIARDYSFKKDLLQSLNALVMKIITSVLYEDIYVDFKTLLPLSQTYSANYLDNTLKLYSFMIKDIARSLTQTSTQPEYLIELMPMLFDSAYESISHGSSQEAATLLLTSIFSLCRELELEGMKPGQLSTITTIVNNQLFRKGFITQSLPSCMSRLAITPPTRNKYINDFKSSLQSHLSHYSDCECVVIDLFKLESKDSIFSEAIEVISNEDKLSKDKTLKSTPCFVYLLDVLALICNSSQFQSMKKISSASRLDSISGITFENNNILSSFLSNLFDLLGQYFTNSELGDQDAKNMGNWMKLSVEPFLISLTRALKSITAPPPSTAEMDLKWQGPLIHLLKEKIIFSESRALFYLVTNACSVTSPQFAALVLGVRGILILTDDLMSAAHFLPDPPVQTPKIIEILNESDLLVSDSLTQILSLSQSTILASAASILGAALETASLRNEVANDISTLQSLKKFCNFSPPANYSSASSFILEAQAKVLYSLSILSLQSANVRSHLLSSHASLPDITGRLLNRIAECDFLDDQKRSCMNDLMRSVAVGALSGKYKNAMMESNLLEAFVKYCMSGPLNSSKNSEGTNLTTHESSFASFVTSIIVHLVLDKHQKLSQDMSELPDCSMEELESLQKIKTLSTPPDAAAPDIDDTDETLTKQIRTKMITETSLGKLLVRLANCLPPASPSSALLPQSATEQERNASRIADSAAWRAQNLVEILVPLSETPDMAVGLVKDNLLAVSLRLSEWWEERSRSTLKSPPIDPKSLGAQVLQKARQVLSRLTLQVRNISGLLAAQQRRIALQLVRQMKIANHQFPIFESAIALHNLAADSNEARSAMWNEGAWDAFKDLMFEENPRLRRAGLEGLVNLSLDEAVSNVLHESDLKIISVFIPPQNPDSEMIEQQGGLEIIVGTLRAAAGLLATVSYDPLICEKILKLLKTEDVSSSHGNWSGNHFASKIIWMLRADKSKFEGIFERGACLLENLVIAIESEKKEVNDLTSVERKLLVAHKAYCNLD